MSTIPLGIKLEIPVFRRELVTRPRLFDRLDQGFHASLILVSAPAGSGKTTLICDWLRTVKLPVAWFTLDEADNDPGHFLANLATALQKIDEDVGHTVLNMLGSPQRPPLDTLMIGLINEISAWSSHFLLLLDDYHTVEAQPIHDLLALLLDHRPAHMHIVLLSRADPPLSLSRLRGRGQLAELREAELRFNQAEIEALLNQQMGLALSDAEIAAVDRRTEGWITGLHLLALSAQGREDIADFVERFTGSHHYIVDYLTDEVLNRLPEAIQRFLLQTSILTRLSGPLCDAVCYGSRSDGPDLVADPVPKSRGQTLLEALDAANLFVVPLDDERRWYRYHRLFADVLRHRLRRTEPHRWPELHLRAARWYEQNGSAREAIDHALHAEAYAEAARLVENNAFSALKRGELTTVTGWIDRLPEKVVHEHPMLSVYRAWALLLTGQVSRIEPSLQAVDSARHPGSVRLSDEKQMPAATVGADEIEGHLSAIRCYVAAVSGEPTRAMALGQQSLALLPKESDDVRSIVTFVMGGLAMMRGDMASAEAAFVDAGERGRTSGNINLAAPAMRALGDIRAMQGRLHQAAETFRDARDLATTPRGRPLPIAAGALRGLGELSYEWNDLAAAEHNLEQGLELALQWGQVDSIVSTQVALAHLRQTQGNFEAVQDLLQTAAQTVRRRISTPTVGGALAAQQMRFYLAQGDLAAAARCAQERGLHAGEELSYAREIELVALARLLMAKAEWQTAQELLTRLRAAAELGGRTTQAIETLILQSLTFQAQSESSQAIARLETALSLAEPEGYVRTFVDEGEPLADLLFRFKARPESRRLKGYVSKLLVVLEKDEEIVSAFSPVQALIEPLSDRELEVLRLVAGGFSNHEIAEKLVIAVGTVKAHTASIYGKLGVHSRTQAVARSRELDLL